MHRPDSAANAAMLTYQKALALSRAAEDLQAAARTWLLAAAAAELPAASPPSVPPAPPAIAGELSAGRSRDIAVARCAPIAPRADGRAATVRTTRPRVLDIDAANAELAGLPRRARR